jgi:hypothetical protein
MKKSPALMIRKSKIFFCSRYNFKFVLFLFCFRPGKKTKLKEQKYGFGGRKKRGKYNTAESYAEAFKNPVKNSKKGNKSGGGGGGKVNKKFVNKNKPKSKR